MLMGKKNNATGKNDLPFFNRGTNEKTFEIRGQGIKRRDKIGSSGAR